MKPAETPLKEKMINEIFDDLKDKAYNSDYHNYSFKETNQVIRKYFEVLINRIEQKPEADLREELINKVNEQKKVSEKQLSDWSFNDMCEHAIEARGQIMAWDYLIEYLTDKQ